MNLRKLWKRYSNGDVRSLDVNNTELNVMTLLSSGFFLTEKEAEAGKIIDDSIAKLAAKKPIKKTVKIIKS